MFSTLPEPYSGVLSFSIFRFNEDEFLRASSLMTWIYESRRMQKSHYPSKVADGCERVMHLAIPQFPKYFRCT